MATGNGTTITFGGSGGLVCVECKIKEGRIGGLILASIGAFWIVSQVAFLSAVPSWGISFFAAPMAISFLVGVGMLAFGIIRYMSSQDKLYRFQSTLPLKAKFPAKIELGVSKCPNCGGVLKKMPQKPGEVVYCVYCGAPIVQQTSL
jgi:hypothetical protein